MALTTLACERLKRGSIIVTAAIIWHPVHVSRGSARSIDRLFHILTARTVPKRNLLPASLVLEKLAAPVVAEMADFISTGWNHAPSVWRSSCKSFSAVRQRRKIVLVKTLWSIASTRREERITRSRKSHRSSCFSSLSFENTVADLRVFSLLRKCRLSAENLLKIHSEEFGKKI